MVDKMYSLVTATDETFSVKDGVARIVEKATYEGVVRLPSGGCQLSISQRREIWKTHTVIGDDFNAIILPYTDAAGMIIWHGIDKKNEGSGAYE